MGSDSGDFNLFEALCSQPDLLELVVQRCIGYKRYLRLACSRLRAAVDACVTRLAWAPSTLDPDDITFTSDFNGANGATNMAILARCPQLQDLSFSGRHVADLSPLAACVGLRRLTHICTAESLAPLAALTHLEQLDCRQSYGLTDLSALVACTALKYLDCSRSGVQHLPPLPCLEALICNNTPLTDISALIACTALKLLDCNNTPLTDLNLSALAACTALTHLDCSNNGITILPPLPASLESLEISGTQCVDLSPLASCAALRTVDCSETPVHDLFPLAACVGLCSLDCSRTPVQDLSPLAACVRLSSLECLDTPVRNLTPLLACKQLEMLVCSHFEGIADQTSQLLQARPDLHIMVDRSEEDKEEEEGEEDGDGYEDDWDAHVEYEMAGHGWGDEDGEGGTSEDEEATW